MIYVREAPFFKLNLQPIHTPSRIHRRKCNCPLQAYESNTALQTVVPPGRLVCCLLLWGGSLALGWAPQGEGMSPWSPCPSGRQKHLLGVEWLVLQGEPRRPLIIDCLNSTLTSSGSDNLASKQDTFIHSKMILWELFRCSWTLLGVEENTKVPSPCFNGALMCHKAPRPLGVFKWCERLHWCETEQRVKELHDIFLAAQLLLYDIKVIAASFRQLC